MSGASAEDVELWLEVGLFLDVRCNDTGKHVWLEAEVVAVRDRSILVQFLSGRPAEWLHVDMDWQRLAELHSHSSNVYQNGGESVSVACYDPPTVYNEIIQRYQHDTTSPADHFAQYYSRWFSQDASTSQSSTSNSNSSTSTSNNTVHNTSCSDDDLTVSCSNLSIPLCDPLTQFRLCIPVRSQYCTHSSVFDLYTHLVHNQNSVEIKCPVCKKDGEQFLTAPSNTAELTIASTAPFSLYTTLRCYPATLSSIPETRRALIHSDGSVQLTVAVSTGDSHNDKKRKRQISNSSSTLSSRSTTSSSTIPHIAHRTSNTDPTTSSSLPMDYIPELSAASDTSTTNALSSTSAASLPDTWLPPSCSPHSSGQHDIIDLTAPPDYDELFNAIYRIKQENIQDRQAALQLQRQEAQDAIAARLLQQQFDAEEATQSSKKKKKKRKKRAKHSRESDDT